MKYNIKRTTAFFLSLSLITTPLFSKKVFAQTKEYSYQKSYIEETVSLTENEAKVLKYFEEIKMFFEQLKEDDTIENIKFQSKKYFIDIVDFFFYDKSINGVKLKDITENGKKYLQKEAFNILSKLEEYSPGIETDLLNAYIKLLEIKENYKKEATELLNYATSFLNQEQKDSLNILKNRIIDIKDGIKEDIEENYEEFRNNFYEEYEKDILEIGNIKVKRIQV